MEERHCALEHIVSTKPNASKSLVRFEVLRTINVMARSFDCIGLGQISSTRMAKALGADLWEVVLPLTDMIGDLVVADLFLPVLRNLVRLLVQTESLETKNARRRVCQVTLVQNIERFLRQVPCDRLPSARAGRWILQILIPMLPSTMHVVAAVV